MSGLTRVTLAAAACAVAGACATARFVPPAGPWVAAPDAAVAWEHATEACRGASLFTAEIHVSGHAGAARHSLHGLTMQAALTRNDEILLTSSSAFVRFKFAGRADLSTLLLTRDNRFVTAPAADIIEALTGLHLGPRDLLAVLSGCVAAGDGPIAGERLSDLLAIRIGAARAYLRAEGGGWQVVHGERPDTLVDYAAPAGPWPSEVRLWSPAGAPIWFALGVTIDQIFVNGSTAPVFRVDVPPDATPMSLGELRSMGPLGDGH